jgi:TRAP-type C4-dicarboxylate transport system substrate-binding protein
MALERGLLDGTCLHFGAVKDVGLMELMKYNTVLGDAGCYMAPIIYIFNAKSWNSLPSDIQKIIMDLEPWLFEETGKSNVSNAQTAINQAKGLGQTFLELTPEELQLWAERAQPVHEKWIEEAEAAGLPARGVFEGLKQMIKEYPE